MVGEGYERVYAEIDLDAIRNNVENMKALLAPGSQIMAVVKADGYGHGAVEVAKGLEGMGRLYGFAVATPEEAYQLRDAGIKEPILVLGYSFPYSYERMVREEIRITVFRPDTLLELSECCARLRKEGIYRKAKVHIKVDTGMCRIGIKPDEGGLAFTEQALSTEGILVEGIFTHLARADEADKSDARRQLALFNDFLALIKARTGREIPVKHCANSAGILELPETCLDVSRAGIAMYGLWPSEEMRRDVPLAPALSLYSTIIYIKEIETGQAVSYGGCFVAKKRMRIATIPVGYGDGYPRGLSGCGSVLVHGKRASILGRVCMDQFMVDVTDIPKAREGDKVTLIGRSGEDEITMEQLGELSGRFNYEFACGISKRVPRIYKKGGEVLGIRSGR